MKQAWLLMLALALAGCGEEDERVATNNAAAETVEGAAVAGAPIIDNSEIMNEIAKRRDSAKEPADAVPRETPPSGRRPPWLPRIEYRAIGTEPFWAVTVRGAAAVLERPDKPPVRYTVSRQDDQRTIRYLGESFSMTVSEGPCSDGMSDAIWSDRVQVAFGEGTLKGCGGERDDRGMGTP